VPGVARTVSLERVAETFLFLLAVSSRSTVFSHPRVRSFVRSFVRSCSRTTLPRRALASLFRVLATLVRHGLQRAQVEPFLGRDGAHLFERRLGRDFLSREQPKAAVVLAAPGAALPVVSRRDRRLTAADDRPVIPRADGVALVARLAASETDERGE